MNLHHIAYVCDDIQKKAAELKALFGCVVSTPIEDAHQGVRIVFAVYPDGTRIELLEPTGPNSPVWRHLQRGGGFYHLCFAVDDLDHTLSTVTGDNQAIVVKAAASAPAINGCRVAFVVTAQKELIEFLELK